MLQKIYNLNTNSVVLFSLLCHPHPSKLKLSCGLVLLSVEHCFSEMLVVKSLIALLLTGYLINNLMNDFIVLSKCTRHQSVVTSGKTVVKTVVRLTSLVDI